MNWYIGQKIVAVGDTRLFKEGTVFTIKALREGCLCKGKRTVIDVGLTAPVGTTICHKCGVKIKDNGVQWCAEECFAPIEPKQELSEHTTETLIEELEEQLQPC